MSRMGFLEEIERRAITAKVALFGGRRPETAVSTLEGSTRLIVFRAEPIDKQLFHRFIVGHQYVADGVAADEVTNLFGEVFGVVASTLQGLRHKNDL